MSIEENRNIVIGLLENISKWNIDAIMATLAEDSNWWVAGSIPQISGDHPKQVMGMVFQQFSALVPKGLNLTLDNVIAEGNFVAVEGHSNAELPTGAAYQNKYHWLFEIRDGKVHMAKEYLDTLLLKETMESMMG